MARRGWGNNFIAGLQTGYDLADRYKAAQEQDQLKADLKAIQSAMPQEQTQFSEQQGMRLGELANQGANIQYDQGLGGYMATQGAAADGMGPAASREFIAPQRQGVQFLGQTYDSMPSAADLSYARRTAMADRVGVIDPERGMSLRSKADTLYATDTAMADKRAAEALEKGAAEWLKGVSTQDLVGQFGAIINPVDSGMPGMLNFDEKTGGATMIYTLGDKTYTANLSPNEIKDYARQAYIAGKGDMTAGLPALLTSLQGAQEKDVKGRTAALNLQNVESQIGDRAEGRRLQERRDQVIADHYGASRDLTRRGQDVQMARVGASAAAANQKANAAPKPVVAKPDYQEERALRQLDIQLQNMQIAPEEHAARQQQIYDGIQVRTTVVNTAPMVKRALANGESIESVVAALEQRKYPPQVIQQILGSVGSVPPSAPRQGMTVPSNRPAPPPSGPSPVTREEPADAPQPAAKSAPKPEAKAKPKAKTADTKLTPAEVAFASRFATAKPGDGARVMPPETAVSVQAARAAAQRRALRGF